MYEPTTTAGRWLVGITYSVLLVAGAGAVAPDPTGVLTLPVLLAGLAVLYHASEGDHFRALWGSIAAFLALGAALAAASALAPAFGLGAVRPPAPLTGVLGIALLVGGYVVTLR